ncbi:hypothetical protein TSOC_008816 [Tetrabaena socialis]|uniref:J domain-containing protein n=1 Tax=Tetrabaena socialis TaxID=47790 RepID=A0A2J7ZXH7_9CHLO|nr:hypothetical protein TSOC_008816 [Tetrabaena socialis]|eukprot:PNH04977.1 hypothetical protein TSOC_008816 [Tetrabaena socialis]
MGVVALWLFHRATSREDELAQAKQDLADLQNELSSSRVQLAEQTKRIADFDATLQAEVQALQSLMGDECEALRSQCTEAQRQHEGTVLALQQREAELAEARAAAIEAATLRSQCTEAQRQHDGTMLALQQREAELVEARAAAVEAAKRDDLAAAKAAAAAREAEVAVAAAVKSETQLEWMREKLAAACSDARVAEELKTAQKEEWAKERRALEAAESAVRAELQEARTRLVEAARRLEEQQASAKAKAKELKNELRLLESAEAARMEARRENSAREVKHVLDSIGKPYKMLRLQLDCTAAEVREAHRRLLLHVHPDKCGANANEPVWAQANKASTVMKDAHDLLLRRLETQGSTGARGA